MRAGRSDWLVNNSLVVLAEPADSSAVFIFSRNEEKRDGQTTEYLQREGGRKGERARDR